MPRQLIISLVGDASKFTKTLDQATAQTKTFGEKVQAAGTKMTKFVSVPIVGFLGAATKAGLEETAQMDNLAKVLENTTGATRKQVRAVEDQIGAFQKVSNFSDGEMRPAFEDLVIATKDVEDATKLMASALDIATATGKPLEQVTEAMAKAHLGNVGALGRLGIATKDAAGETLTFEEIMKQANETYGGAAQAASETTAGKMKQLRMTMGDLTEDIGKELIPVIEKAVGLFTGFTDWLNRTGIGADKLIIALLAAAALGPVITIITNLTTAVRFLNAAMAANPALALAAAFTVVAVAADKMWQNFGFLDSGLTSLNRTWENLTRQVGDFITMVKKIPSKIPGVGVIGDIGGAIGGVLRNPFRAAGGPVTGGNPYIVGERGPELFVPGRSGSIVPNHALGGGAQTITVQLVVDGQVLTEVVHNGLLSKQRRSGNLGIEAA